MEIDPKIGLIPTILAIKAPTLMMISQYDLCMAKCIIQKPNGTNGKYGPCDSLCINENWKPTKIVVHPVEKIN